MHVRHLLPTLGLLLTLGCGDKPDPDDPDGDGYTAEDDCAPQDPDINPGASEQTYDGVDNDCDPTSPDDDLDEDGYPLEEDCDDLLAQVNPAAEELCDGVDNDCDGTIDVGALDSLTWHADRDGDGAGSPDDTLDACELPDGYTADSSDCDDSREDIYPGGVETCDTLDNDCDETTDEGVSSTWYPDGDGDGYGVSEQPTPACEPLSGYSLVPNDCDDGDPTVNPGAPEDCDGGDDDCDGRVDEGC